MDSDTQDNYFASYVDSCVIFDQFGVMVQLTLALVCTLALVVKRYYDPYRRPWLIWIMDSSKQIFGQGLIHIFNISFASLTSIYTQNQYPCRLYFIYMMSDLFLLTYSCYLMLLAAEVAFRRCPPLSFRTGYYGKHKVKAWLYQLSIWMLIVFLAKIGVLVINLVFMPFFDYIGAIALYGFKDNPKTELIIVMIVFPMLVTSIQLWWTDSFIQSQEPLKEYREENEETMFLTTLYTPIKEQDEKTMHSLQENLLNKG